MLRQQHIEGDDYRLNVVNGRLRFVVRRSVPRVVGDGRATVAILIERENAKRRALRLRDGLSSPIDSDDQQVIDRILRAGFTLDAVLPRGEVIVLRSNANLSTGGLREEIDPCNVHPVIRRQCEAIAITCGLDCCGIDYISTDISSEPDAVNGAFIEINSTPECSPERGGMLLENLFRDQQVQRIPVVVALADWSQLDVISLASMLDAIQVQYPISAISFHASLSPILKPLFTDSRRDLMQIHQHPREPLLNRSATGVLYLMTPSLLQQHGLPTDRVDLVVCHPELPPLKPVEPWIRFLADQPTA